MTLLFGHVRRWRAADVEVAYAQLNRVRHQLLSLSDELAGAAQPASWTGTAAEAARQQLERLTDRMEHLIAEIAAAVRAIDDIADDVAAVAGWVIDAETHARHHGLTITHGGDVEEIEFNLTDLNFPERRARKNEVREMVARIMRRANDIDDHLTSVFERIAAGRIGDGGATTLPDANAAGHREGSLHTYLMNKYQVSVDPEGRVMYPDGVPGWALKRTGREPQLITKGEAELLEDIGLAGLKDSYDIYKTALHEAGKVYERVGWQDGHSDAFRHAYWNAMLANRFGQEWTERYTTAHERVGDTHASAEAMDLHNNEVGRRIAAEHPDAGPEELHRLVDEAVRRGDMVVVGPDGTLVRSNEVPLGGTGEAKDPPGQGGQNPPEREDGDDHSGGYNPGTDGENYGTTDN